MRRRERDDPDNAVPVAHTDSRDADPVVGLGLGDQIQHVTARNDHQALARVGFDTDTVGLRLRDPRSADEEWYRAELVEREQTGQGLALHG